MLLLTGTHEHDPRKHNPFARKALIIYFTLLRTMLRHPEQREWMYNAVSENSGSRAGHAWFRTALEIEG
jgi:hypothetical protein